MSHCLVDKAVLNAGGSIPLILCTFITCVNAQIPSAKDSLQCTQQIILILLCYLKIFFLLVLKVKSFYFASHPHCSLDILSLLRSGLFMIFVYLWLMQILT